MKQPLIIIAGTTASCKTSTAVELAKKINGEIISADSMQVYKFMDIGTAKPTEEDMQGIPHYIIDELYPDEEFNVSVFAKKAKKYLNIIYNNNKIPIIVGGTGFYINAILRDTDFNEVKVDYEYRNYLYEQSKINGKLYLHDMLKALDPVSAESIHYNNVKKVIRALEFYKQTNTSIALYNKTQKEKEPPYNYAFFILTMDRKILYERIEQRVDNMINDGLVCEVEKISKMNSGSVALQGIGYKELILYLNGELSLDDAIIKIKQNTRHFAKRQLTWFKTQSQGCWINVDKLNFNVDKIVMEIRDYIEKNIFLL